MLTIKRKTAIALGAAGVVAAVAAAIAVPALTGSDPTPKLQAVEAGVLAVSPSTREADLVIQCGGDLEGESLKVEIDRQIDVNALRPGDTLRGVIATPSNVLLQLTPNVSACGDGDEGSAFGSGTTATDTGTSTTATTTATETAPAGGGNGGSVIPGLPPFDQAFIRSTRTFVGDTNLDNGVLEFDIDQIPGLSIRFAPQARVLLDEKARIVLGGGARIVDGAGRSVSRILLEDAVVRVTGTLARPEAWQFDNDGDPVPVIHANRVVVLRVDLG